MSEHGSKKARHDGAERSEAEDLERIKALPKEVGVLLVVLGVGGMLLPGPVGSPLILLGGVVLWPRAFERFEGSFRRHFPKTHRQSLRQIRRFVDDLERRYPNPPDRAAVDT